MSTSNAPRVNEPAGPFRADQIREGDPYELSNGHAIKCMSAGPRHGAANLDGGRVLATDPAVEGSAGVDVGFAFNEGKNLRAPDVSVGNVGREPGWVKVAPPLAVEYADTGQDEKELQAKIEELLGQGTRFIWVVRLLGPLRVEVYEPGKPVRLVDGDGTLTAPGVLQNPVPVRALVDPEAANEATLRNLLNRKGYRSLEDVQEAARLEGLRQAIFDLCEVLGIELGAERQSHVEGLDGEGLQALRTHLKQRREWPR